jgi:hypothetical protein
MMSPKLFSEQKELSDVNLLNSIEELADKISNNELLVADFPQTVAPGCISSVLFEPSTAAGNFVYRRFRIRPVVADLVASLAGLGPDRSAAR